MLSSAPTNETQRSYARRLARSAFLKLSAWRAPLQAARCLWFDYGHVRSAATGRSVDAAGEPVPWYTYAAIEYIRQLDFCDKRVFEYGSGASTLFWAANALQVVSVEDDEAWHAMLVPQIPSNCELILESDLARYVDVIHRFPDGFDVIVVDGAARARTRLKCSRAALEHLRPGGLIILDNSDWLPESARVLREHGLIQVDMAGFAPMVGHTQTTSLFFDRRFVTRPKGSRLPQPGPGAAAKNWERLAPPAEPSIVFGGDSFGGVEQDTPVSFSTPAGLRRFRLLSGRDTIVWSALLDVDAERVLLYVVERDDIRDLSAVPRMSWDVFREFIRRHPRRRYVL
jgi:hypothetical protein